MERVAAIAVFPNVGGAFYLGQKPLVMHTGY